MVLPKATAFLVQLPKATQWKAQVQFSSVAQSCLTLCDPMDGARQASLSITNSQNSLKLMSIVSVIPSNHSILCRSLLLLPSICSSIRVFSNESALPIRWPKYWSFSFSVSPSNVYSGLISFRNDWFDPLSESPLDSQRSSPTRLKSINSQHSAFLWSIFNISTWLLEKPKPWL